MTTPHTTAEPAEKLIGDMDNKQADPFYALIGARIRAERERRRLSQPALAELISIPQPTLSKLESGQQQVPVHLLLAIAQVLNIAIDQLLPGELICPLYQRPIVQRIEGCPLSAREVEVLKCIAAGKTNRAISDALAISTQTVKNHIKTILDKLRVERRAAAVVAALSAGWIELPTREESES